MTASSDDRKGQDFTFPIDIYDARELLAKLERHGNVLESWARIEKRTGLKFDLAIMAASFSELVAPHKSPTETRETWLETRGLLYIYGFIIGHELAHAWGYCPLTTPSPVETSGMFDAVVKMQTKGLLWPWPIRRAELAADRCALRTVAAIEAKVDASSDGAETGQEVRGLSRLLAAEAIGWITTVGLGGNSLDSVAFLDDPKSADPGMRVTIKDRKGYLYAPLRLALFATLLRQLEDIPYVGACDSVAEQILTGMGVAVRSCETGDGWKMRWGRAGDALGHYFPANSVIHSPNAPVGALKQQHFVHYMSRCQ